MALSDSGPLSTIAENQQLATGLLEALTDRINALERRCNWLEAQLKPFYNEWGSLEDAERVHFLYHLSFTDDLHRTIPTLAQCPEHKRFLASGQAVKTDTSGKLTTWSREA